MALPDDATVCTVSFGPYTDAEGLAALVSSGGKLTTVAADTGKPINVTHVATGQVILPKAVDITIGSDGTGSVGPIPHTDNPGLSPVGFAYRVEWNIASNKPSPRNKTFALPQARGATADFDLLDEAEAVPGVLVPIGEGPQGEPGLTAYEVAVAGGFVGTEAAWLASLKGEQGDPGDPSVTPEAVAANLPARLSEEELRAASVAAAKDSGAFAQAALATHPARLADVRRSKGGVIGTSGKGVVAWRVDHQLDEHRSTTWPILRDRGMPCGLGVVTKAVGDPADPADPTATTWAQLTTAHWEGCEMWAHSATHLDPAPLGGGLTITEEIAGCRTEMESHNLHPVGWQMPGITGVQTANYSANFTSKEQLTSDVGQLLLANYALLDVDRGLQGARRVLPTFGDYCLGHVTIETLTLAQAKAQVDLAVQYGMGIQLMFHPRYIGQAGKMSVADFTALADYVKSLWDAGSIEVLSPSGLAFADPGSSRRLDLLRQGGFEGITPAGLVYGAWTANNATGVTIGTDGGFEGSNYARFSGSVNYLQQSYTLVGEGNFGAAAFLVEARVRNASGAPSTARIVVTDNSGNNPTFTRDVRFNLTAGQGWTKIRVPLCIPKTCTNLLTRISRFTTGSDGATGDVDFDAVKVLAI